MSAAWIRHRWVVALVLLGLLLSACTSAVGELKSTVADPDDPQRGGVLRLAVTTDLIPATVFTNSSFAADTLIGAVYDSLIDYDTKTLEPHPSLATSWSFSPDRTKLTLKLRRGVKYHDGREFTSKDVEFSLKTVADPVWTSQFQRTAAAITGFDTSKPYEITLSFDHPLGNIFDLLDITPMIDRNSFDQLKAGQAYIGTGPYVFDSWTPGSSLEFDRNDDYWRPGRPYLDGIDIDIVADAQSQVSLLRAGQLDAGLGIATRDAETMEESGLFRRVTLSGSAKNIYIGMNVANDQLKNVKLRQAVAYALDRERIMSEIYRNQGYPTSLPWPKFSPAYDEQASHRYDLDRDKARELVAELGDLKPITLTYPSATPNIAAAAQVVQNDLNAVGIPVTLDPQDQATAVKMLIGGEMPGLWMLEHSYAQFTPSTLTVSAYPFNADKNTSHFSSPAYTEHANSAWELASATDRRAQKSYDDLNADLLDNLFLAEIGIYQLQLVTSNAVAGVTWSRRGELNFTNAFLEGS